jgi:hypothetical protein
MSKLLRSLLTTTAFLTLAPTAQAASVTSNVTISYAAGSAPSGYAYPNQTITFTSDVDPGNASNIRQVRLMRWVPSTGVWVAVTGYQPTGPLGGSTFTDTIPRNEPYARWNVQVKAHTTPGGVVWTSAISPTLTITQTHGSEALSMKTFSPKIVETGGNADVEPRSNAAQLARVDFVGSPGAARVIDLQQRDAGVWGDNYWHDLGVTRNVAIGESGSWWPQYGFFSGSEYRAIYHYNTGVDNASPVFQPSGIAAEFSDEFSGIALDTSIWVQRLPNSGQGYEVHSMDPALVGVSNGALHLRPRKAPEDTCSHVMAIKKDGSGDPVPWHGQECIETPHITTEQSKGGGYTIARPDDNGDLWVAIRARVQPGPAPGYGGPQSSLWWNAGYCNDNGGETDVMEFFGENNNAGRMNHQVYWSADGCDLEAETAIQAKNTVAEANPGTPGSVWSDRYHIYAVRIQQATAGGPPTYTFFIDGKKVHAASTANVGPSPASAPRIASIPGLILTNIIRDANNYGAGSIDNSTFDVDWVQTWRMPPVP